MINTRFQLLKRRKYRLVIFICPILILVFGLNSIYYYIIILPRSDFTKLVTLLLFNLKAFIHNLLPCHITTIVSALRHTIKPQAFGNHSWKELNAEEWYRSPSTRIHIGHVVLTCSKYVPCRGQWITFLPSQGITGNIAQYTKDSKNILPLIWKPPPSVQRCRLRSQNHKATINRL